MLSNILKKYDIILGSASIRRKQLLDQLQLNFSIRVTKEKETYSKDLTSVEIAKFLAKQKANFITKNLSGNYLLITADTIVVQNNIILHKPKNKDEAKIILKSLSGKSHKVISGVCLRSNKKEISFSSETKVTFSKLSEDEIAYYIKKFKPYDKAGSYGIQEWIGYIGIEEISGSYNNVIGLPTAELYQNLKLFI